MIGLGTIINVATVVAGSAVGLLIGKRIPEAMRETVVQVVGLVTIAIGVKDAIGTHNMVFPLVGMVIGAIIGELLRVEDRLEKIGHVLKRRFAKTDESGDEHGFVRGFVTASLLYCVGPLTILGAIQDASGQTPQLYIIKGSLDGFISVIFAAIYGVGVMFSAVSVFIVQGTLTALGTSIDSLLDDRMRLELFSAGGLAVVAIGINLLEIKKIRLGSLLPGLVVTPILVAIFAR
ncbi:MAG: DUF554 domain-containing protein [Ilumatobacteraceae bacterium]|jgi:uncharacterized membrane protein YqgA involved in biofilm formation|nr:DUF554 domain-containing protein [Ilumatobacteraceae bacterium]MBJ7367088.1 DUF554 domain-containing protein [Ilumatobacteraceae bacterium]